MEHESYARLVRIGGGIMLLLGLGTWPYSYYQLLRIAICLGSFYLVWYFMQVKMYGWGWLFIIPGILFNPLLPVYMAESIWQVADVLFAIMFFASLSTENTAKK